MLAVTKQMQANIDDFFFQEWYAKEKKNLNAIKLNYLNYMKLA